MQKVLFLLLSNDFISKFGSYFKHVHEFIYFDTGKLGDTLDFFALVGSLAFLLVRFTAYQPFSTPNKFILINVCMFGLVLWHINHCRLFNAKSILYI